MNAGEIQPAKGSHRREKSPVGRKSQKAPLKNEWALGKQTRVALGCRVSPNNVSGIETVGVSAGKKSK